MARVLQLDSLGNIAEVVNPQTADDTAFDPSKLGKLSSFTVQDAIDELVSKHYTLAADVSGLHTQVDSLTHNGFSDVALAATGVTYGHVTDAAQTIAGQKTFSDRTAIGNTAADHKLTIAGAGGIESSLLLKDTTNSKQVILRPVSDGALLAVGGSNAISIGRYADPVALSSYSEIARYTELGLYGVNRQTPIGMIHVGHTGGSVLGQLTSTVTTDNGLVIENTTAGLTQLRSDVTSGGQPHDSDIVLYNKWYNGSEYAWREVARFTSKQMWGNGTTNPTYPIHVERNSTAIGIAYQPAVNVSNTSSTQGAGGTTVNRASYRASAGNGSINMSIIATYEADGSFVTGGHIYIAQSYPLVFWTNNTKRGRFTAAGNFEADNYTKLGSTAPAIKVKELTGTTGATQGSSTVLAHGLVGDKIVSITATVRYATNSGMTPEHQATAGYQYSVSYDATNATIKLSTANSTNILSKAFSIFITYKE